MQGQRGAIGSLPESLGFDHGSTPSEAGIDQHICWNNMRNSASNHLSDYVSPNNTGVAYLNSTSPEGQNLSGWSMGEPSSSAVQNQLSHNELKAEHSWASSMSAGDGPILEDQQYAPESGLSLNDVNVNLSSNQIASGPLFLQSSSSDSFSQDLNINAGFEGQGVDDCQIVECPLVFRSGSSENSRVQSGSSSSNPFGLRRGEYMEENDGRPGYSVDGRRLSCKRKAIEGNIGQSSGSGSSNYFQHAEGSVWHAVPARRNTGSSLTISAPSESSIGLSQPEQVNPRLGLGVGGVASDIPPALSAAGSAESSRRNFRLRINSSHQQDSISTNVFAAGSAVGLSNVSSSHQSSRLLPLHNALDLRSATVADSASPQGQSLLAHVPAMRRNLQSSRWNRSSSSRPGSSSSFPVAGERDTASHEESSSRSIPRNISEHPMFVPASGMRNSAQSPVNWSLPGGNATASSRSGSTSGVHQTSGPNWVPHRNSPQYPRRLSEFVRRSLLSSSGPESGGQNINISPPRSGTSASSQEVAPSSGDQGHHLSLSRSAMLLDRHLDGAFGIPYSLRTLAAANEGRSRLVSEIRNVLDLMRRGEGLRFEDVMILNQSVFFGMGDIHDRHRDMRLDVDNMSYEELLALEERIGNVNTGLSEETISSCLKQSKYALVKTDQEDAEPCCICREEYNDEDVLGKLECGHDFHVDCIKQWLTHKNLCPICKTTAMGTREKP